jgi:DNA-directed RNA polymerase subunit H (RpoH/RPB5)
MASGRRRGGRKAGGAGAEPLHHDFDEHFVRQYEVLLNMVLERGYGGEGLVGVEPVPPDHEPSEYDLEDGIIGDYAVRVDPVTTAQELTATHGGLEAFSLKLLHQDARLNMLVYYLVPEAESNTAATEKKQLSESHVKQYVKLFTEAATPTGGTFSRLILITRVKPSSEAISYVTEHNYKLRQRNPLSLITLLLASFFDFNPSRWALQPSNVRIYRDEVKARMLRELDVNRRFKGQEEVLLPQMSEIDPLSVYYGTSVGDLITFTRREPPIFFMRIVIPDVLAQ